MTKFNLTPRPFHGFAIASFAVAGFFLAPPADAQNEQGAILYSTDFTGGTGGQPVPGWTLVSNNPQADAAYGSDDTYRLGRTAHNWSTTALFTNNETPLWNGEGTLDNATSLWTDYQISATFQSANVTAAGTQIGLIARWDGTNPGGTAQAAGYFAFIRPDQGQLQMYIRRNFSRGPENANFLAVQTIPEFLLTNNSTYTITFSVVGAALEFTFISDDFSHTISVIDEDPHLVGSPGLRTHFAANDRFAHFDEYSVTVIPEPSTVAGIAGLFALGGAFVLRRRRLAGRKS